MTTQTASLTSDRLSNMTASQMRPLAQQLKLAGAWKATKSELFQMLLNHYEATEAQPKVEPEPTEVEPQADPEVTENLWETIQVEPSSQPISQPISKTPDTVQQLLLLNPAPQVEPQAKAKKQAKAKTSKTYELTTLTEQQISWLLDHASVTAPTCSDPGRLVVNRSLVRQLIEDIHGQHISEKVFNQLVVLASRKLPRQPMTIQSASRFKYLLAETKQGQEYPPIVLVADYLLAHPELYSQAATNYQVAAETGLEHITEWMSSQA